MTQERQHQLGQLVGANKNDHYYELHYTTGETARLYILGGGIFRYWLDPSNQFNEENSPLVDLSKFNQQTFKKSQPRATSDSLIIQAGPYRLIFEQRPAIMNIFDENLHRTRLIQLSPLELGPDQSTEILRQNKNEFYFGGGLQNGFFSHKGMRIAIQTDQITGRGGILSQVPFFWSNAGFGELRNTLQAGSYDFGKQDAQATIISHKSASFDNFYLLGNSPQAILRQYYQLTGRPLMLPRYALGLGHLGNYLTTLWRPSAAKERNAQAFEDNNYYVRTKQTDAASGKASLNGEEEYQFSARAMIDRYQKRHFSLSWFVPNYGQQEVDPDAFATFDEYANTHGLEAGLWTKEAQASVRKHTALISTNTANLPTLRQDTAALKTSLNRRRPLVLSNHGQAGSQQYAALVYGSPGGNWASIGTQIAGFLGANLSGEPFVGSAIAGTVGGGNAQIAIRDFEWKTFTPLFFYLNDQGRFSKTPFAYNGKLTAINRAYLELRQELTNYLYSLVYQAQEGQPLLRALFVEFPHEQVNYTEQVDHEFMLGPSLLIAPITNGREDSKGNSRKDNLYLPDHRTMWVDLFTGQKYLGGRVYNKLTYPLWHLPVFVRNGAIFDLGKRNYVLYPHGKSQLTSYADNGFTDYDHNHTSTTITSNLVSSKLTVKLDAVKGDFSGMPTKEGTKLNIMCDAYPDQIEVKVNDEEIKLQEYGTAQAFEHAKQGFFYNTSYSWLPAFDHYWTSKQTALQIKLSERDLTDTKIQITIKNFNYGNQTLVHSITDSLLHSPKQPKIDPDSITAHSFTLYWPQVTNQVQVQMNGLLYDGINGQSFTFHELKPHARYLLRLRYVAGNKVSEWSAPFGAITKRAALDYAVKGTQVTCNYEAKTDHPLRYLTDLKAASEWITKDKFQADRPLQLTFNFPHLENLSRMAYLPRKIDHNGDPTEVGIEISTDGRSFKPYGDHYQWKADSKNKVIGLRNVRARMIRLTVYKSSGPLVAGKEVLFFKQKQTHQEHH